MKANKMLYLDTEVIEFLSKQDAASKLVNRLILEHIDREDLEHMTEKQLLAELEVNKIQEETDRKIKELRKNAIK